MVELWFEADGTPDPAIAWWAVEHVGHPAFYLRAFMAGDFAPGQLVLPRHIITLKGEETDTVKCGHCRRKIKTPEDLVVFERETRRSDFLEIYHLRRAPWPAPTDPDSCWLCSNRGQPARHAAKKKWGDVNLCPQCAAFEARRLRAAVKPAKPEGVRTR